jgi:preprotein translocase subunit SecG
MFTVLLVVHLIVAASLVGVVLLQRSEGGALGGLGGGQGGFMTGRGAANVLTRTTAILFAAFLVTSILLSILGNMQNKHKSILDAPVDSVPAQPAPAVPAPVPSPAKPAVPLPE